MKVKKGVFAQEIGNSYVLFDNENSELHEVNVVAYEIFNLLSEGVEVKDVAEKIAAKYSKEKKSIEKDVSGFISVLKEKGLISN